MKKVHIYTEYGVFAGLKYLNLFGCNAHSKSDHEIASMDGIVYNRVKYVVVNWPTFSLSQLYIFYSQAWHHYRNVTPQHSQVVGYYFSKLWGSLPFS